jgi:hypothetical protein
MERQIARLYQQGEIEAVVLATVTETTSAAQAEADQDGNIREAFVRQRLKGTGVSGDIRFTSWREQIRAAYGPGSGDIVVSSCRIHRLTDAAEGQLIVVYLKKGADGRPVVLQTARLLDALNADRHIRILWEETVVSAQSPD